jgi:cytidylate kinase
MNHFRSLDSIKGYLAAEVRKRRSGETRPREREFGPEFITLSRQSGAGGLRVADAVAENLSREDIHSSVPWVVFDRNLLRQVIEEHELPEEYMKYMEETFTPNIQTAIEGLLDLHPSMTQLVGKTNRTILHLATTGSVIIVGRGANLVTRNLPGGFHVRLVGSQAARVRSIMEDHDIEEEGAWKHMKEVDNGREKYVKNYFDANIDDHLIYHLVLNTDRWHPGQTARLIAEGLRIRRSKAENG